MTRHAPRRRFSRPALLLSAGLFTLALTLSAGAQTSGRTLDIYWIDVEGGAATLVLTPERESILMDTGWPRPDGRDTDRILAAMEDADLSELDYVLISHFHTDHVGGISALAERVPIGQLVDHGDSVELNRESSRPLWDEYVAVAEGRRRSVAPGDKLPLRRIELSFIAAHRSLIDTLEPRGPNPLCSAASEPEPDMGENGHSLGYLLSFGAFQFLNMGDLTPDREHALACPENRLGAVDLYQAPHHGGYGAIRPELTGALRPTVMVVNNGPRKGGTPDSLVVAQQTDVIEDVWQAHLALADDAAYNTDEALIANLTEEDECAGHWIKATVAADGRSWTMTNGRTGHTRSYMSR